jgi:hypothetical protein
MISENLKDLLLQAQEDKVLNKISLFNQFKGEYMFYKKIVYCSLLLIIPTLSFLIYFNFSYYDSLGDFVESGGQGLMSLILIASLTVGCFQLLHVLYSHNEVYQTKIEELSPILEKTLNTLYAEKRIMDILLDSYIFNNITEIRPRNELNFKKKSSLVWMSITALEHYVREFSGKLK